MKSRKKLCADLIEMGVLPAETDYRKLNNEIYGRMACIYLFDNKRTVAERRKIEAELVQRGYKVNPNYSPGTGDMEVQVSYFKGWHWDE